MRLPEHGLFVRVDGCCQHPTPCHLLRYGGVVAVLRVEVRSAGSIPLHVVSFDVWWRGGFEAGRRGSCKGTWIRPVLFLLFIGGTVHAIEL